MVFRSRLTVRIFTKIELGRPKDKTYLTRGLRGEKVRKKGCERTFHAKFGYMNHTHLTLVQGNDMIRYFSRRKEYENEGGLEWKKLGSGGNKARPGE